MVSINFNHKLKLIVIGAVLEAGFFVIDVFVYIGALWVLPQHEAQYLLGFW